MKAFVIFLIILHANIEILSQNPYHIIYNVADGVPSNEIYDVELDDKGRIWITTDRGVALFDGYKFKTYTTGEGLGNNTNFEIIKLKDNFFYFTGYDGSLSYWDGNKIKIHNLNNDLRLVNKGSWILDLKNINDSLSIYINKWVLKSNLNNKFHCISNEKIILKDSINSPVTVDSKELKYYSNLNLLFLKKMNTFLNKFLFKGDTLFYCVDQQNNYFHYTPIGSINHTKKKYLAEIFLFINNEPKLIYSQKNEIHNIFLVKDDIWLCTENGLIKLKEIDGHFIPIEHYFKNANITNYCADQEGNLWLTSINNGLIFIPSLSIKSITGFEKHDIVNAFIEWHKYLIIGLKSPSGFYVLDKNKLVKNNLNNSWYPSFINENDTLISSGIEKYYFDSFVNDLKLIQNRIVPSHRTFISLDNNQYLLGLSNIKLIKDQKIIYTTQSNFGNIMKLFLDSKKTIWMGTLDGLFKLNIIKDKIIVSNNPISYINSRITDITEIPEIGLAVSTLGDGIIILDYQGKIITHLGSENELSSNLINRFYRQNDSIYWVGTNNGLDLLKFNSGKKKIRFNQISSFNTKDGLISNFINDIIFFNENIYLATNNGLNYFSPSHEKKNINSPPIYFDSIKVAHQNILIDSIHTLNYNQNDITFHYTGVSYRKPTNKEFYKYALIQDENNTSWTYTNNRDIQFTNLEHGDYKFIVQARNKYDNWSVQPAEFSFLIRPHYSETLWFKSMAIISILIFSFLIYRIREKAIISREHQKQLLSEAEFKIKQAELNALRNQMNPHFMYNALNSIQNFIFQNKPKMANFFLSKFSHLMRQSLELSKLESISLEEEIKFLENYIEIEKMRFEDKFDYKIIVDPNVALNVKLPPLLLQPLAENAIKHGFRDIKYHGLLKITFSIKNDLLHISVIDNGTGIDMTEKKKRISVYHHSISTTIVRDRIEIINSTLEFPIAQLSIHKVDPHELLSGTQAKIILPLIY